MSFKKVKIDEKKLEEIKEKMDKRMEEVRREYRIKAAKSELDAAKVIFTD